MHESTPPISGSLDGMAHAAVRILEREPDIGRFLAPDEMAEAERLAVPLLALERGPVDLDAEIADFHGFGAVVLDGMLIQRLELDGRLTMRLFGPGDVVGPTSDPGSVLIPDWTLTALEGTRLAVLGDEYLAAVRRWPGLAAGLHVRMCELSDRLAVQLAICELPRVEDRLLAILWWLAEAWGHVTSVGTIVPLAMTHDVLGSLIGARRPSVTLALGELSSRGAIARQDRGWLLLEPPPEPRRTSKDVDDPVLNIMGRSVWQERDADPDPAIDERAHIELLETVRRLRHEHEAHVAAVGEQLRVMRAARERTLTRRHAQRRAGPPSAPSS